MAIDRTNIENILYSTDFFIDGYIGLQYYGKYLHDIELINAGATIKDLGYSNDPRRCAGFLAMDGTPSNKSAAKDTIAKITISGPMFMEGTLCEPGTRELTEYVQELDADKNIRGFKFDVNTGGGEATAGIHWYNTIKDLTKPSITQAHLMASAGYMGFMHTSEVIALSDSSRFGSIGALVSIDKKFMAWYKENIDTIFSSKSPDKHAEVKAYLEGDPSLIVKGLDSLMDDFHSMVIKARKLNPEFKKEVLRGGVFEARPSKTRGLIDTIGGEKFATKRLLSYINQ